MNHTIKLKVDNSGVEERDFFEFVSEEKIVDITPFLDDAVKNVRRKICVVLSSVSSADINRVCAAQCPKYVIVPDINDKNLNPLKGKAIIHEMKWSGTNIFITDNEAVVTCGCSGAVIKDTDAVSVLASHFNKWFWNDSGFELIDEPTGVNNGVFDTPITNTSSGIVIDSDDNISILTQRCDGSSMKAKYNKILDDKELYFRTVPDITLLKGRNKESYLMPDLWASFFEVDGDRYILNYDPPELPTMPEKGTDKVMGIKVNGLKLGSKYKYHQKEYYRNLVGKRIKDSKGKDMEVVRCANESKSLTLPLKEYLFLKELESKDTQMLEERLRTKNKDIVVSNIRACEVEIEISVDIEKHKSKEKDQIYNKYSIMPQILTEKKNELIKAYEDEKMGKKADPIRSLSIPKSFSEFDSYNKIVRELNKYIDNFNNRGGEIDESLADVTSSKKGKQRKTISRLKESEEKPLPRYGTLYKSKDSYEYVLNNESDLKDAEKEAEDRGWKNTTYHLE